MRNYNIVVEGDRWSWSGQVVAETVGEAIRQVFESNLWKELETPDGNLRLEQDDPKELTWSINGDRVSCEFDDSGCIEVTKHILVPFEEQED